MLILREEVLHSYGISASDGILIALSGGADSVALLLEMNRFRKEGKLRTIAAAHLNHGIRGEEALRDAAFLPQQNSGVFLWKRQRGRNGMPF